MLNKKSIKVQDLKLSNRVYFPGTEYKTVVQIDNNTTPELRGKGYKTIKVMACNFNVDYLIFHKSETISIMI